MKRLLGLLLCLCIYSTTVTSQVPCFDFIGYDNIVSLSTSEYYIWVATRNNGLCRIDKITKDKTYYNTTNSQIPSNILRSVYVHNATDLFLSTDSNLVKMDMDVETFSVLQHNVSGIIKQRYNDALVIVGDRDYHEYYIPNNVVSTLNLVPNMVGDHCCSQNTDFDIDNNSRLWIAHHDFYHYSILQPDQNFPQVFHHQNAPLPMESFTKNAMAVSPTNEVWCASWGGLTKFSNLPFPNNEWSTVHNDTMLTIVDEGDTVRGNVADIMFDAEGQMWVGTGYSWFFNDQTQAWEHTSGQIAYYGTDNEWHIYEHFADTTYGVYEMYQDPHDLRNIYIGTDQGLAIIERECAILPFTNNLQEKYSLDVYPNPVSTKGVLQLTDLDINPLNKNTLSLYNNLGQCVHQALINNITELPLAPLQLKRGVYFLQLNDTHYQKIIVK